MKKLFIYIFFMLIVMQIHAGNTQETFLRANKLYKEHEHAQALELYESIKNKGSATWYNMGNCAYKLGKYTDAYVYWRKAQAYATSHEHKAIAHNINALADIIDAQVWVVQDTNAYEWYKPIKNIATARSLLFMQLLFLLLWFLVWYCGAYLLREKRYMLGSMLLSSTLGCALLLALNYREHTKQVALVVQSQIKVFAGPDDHYHCLGYINAIAELEIKEQRDQWYKVCHKDLVGWVFADTIIRV